MFFTRYLDAVRYVATSKTRRKIKKISQWLWQV